MITSCTELVYIRLDSHLNFPVDGAEQASTWSDRGLGGQSFVNRTRDRSFCFQYNTAQSPSPCRCSEACREQRLPRAAPRQEDSLEVQVALQVELQGRLQVCLATWAVAPTHSQRQHNQQAAEDWEEDFLVEHWEVQSPLQLPPHRSSVVLLRHRSRSLKRNQAASRCSPNPLRNRPPQTLCLALNKRLDLVDHLYSPLLRQRNRNSSNSNSNNRNNQLRLYLRPTLAQGVQLTLTICSNVAESEMLERMATAISTSCQLYSWAWETLRARCET